MKNEVTYDVSFKHQGKKLINGGTKQQAIDFLYEMDENEQNDYDVWVFAWNEEIQSGEGSFRTTGDDFMNDPTQFDHYETIEIKAKA